jgi:hypothetical protein
MRKIVILAALAAIVGTATAQASSPGRPCTTASRNQWLPLHDLLIKVETQGYRVQEAEFKRSCGKFEAIDKAGRHVELFVDPTNGQIIGRPDRAYYERD